MADTRVISNDHKTIWVSLTSPSPFTQSPFSGLMTDADFASLLNISSIIKWDGTDFGMQESDQIDDRVLTDLASAQRRGFSQFGGTVEVLTPVDFDDNSDVAVQFWNLVKGRRTPLWLVERVVTQSGVAGRAGDHVNIYRILTDGGQFNTEGETSYSRTYTLLPQGDVYVKRVITPATPVTLSTAGFATALTVGDVTWGKVTMTVPAGTVEMTPLVTGVSDDTSVVTVDKGGRILAVGTGNADVTFTYPGATASTAISITVS